MPANKNQHFVPRCHLKPFSLDGEGVAINIYNASADLGIQNAPIKGQCSRDYFYGRDLRIEKALQNIEGDYARVISKLSTEPELVGNIDFHRLRNFAYLQMSRTESTIKRRAAAIKGMDELAHRGAEAHRKEAPNITHEYLVASALKTWAETLVNIEDLEILILRNRTREAFVTSDDPAILTNRLFMQRLGDASFGLISSGVQLIMPLTPDLALMCYDRSTYSVPNRHGHWVDIRRDSDAKAINELQYISCSSNIYFRNWPTLPTIRDGFARAKPRRPQQWFKWWVGIQVSEDAHGELYRRATEEEAASKATKIVSHSAIYPNPSRWVSELTYRPKIFAYTNGSATGFIREAQAKRFMATRPFVREEVKYRGIHDPLGARTAYVTKRGRDREGPKP